MKQRLRYLCLTLLASTATMVRSDVGTKTAFVPMSVGSNLSRQYHKAIYMDEDDDCSLQVNADISYRYERSFSEDKVASMLFNNNVLLFQGVNIGSRSSNALIAEYFGMGSGTNASVAIKPLIQNHVIDIQLAAGNDNFWGQINLPIAYSRYRLRGTTSGTVSSDLGQSGTLNFAVVNGAFTVNGVIASIVNLNAQLALNADVDGTLAAITNQASEIGFSAFNSISATKNGSSLTLTNRFEDFLLAAEAGTGTTTGTITVPDVAAASSLQQALSGYTFGNLANRQYGMIQLNKDMNQWALADVQLQLGWDFYKKDTSHVAIYAKAVIPTGTQIDQSFARYVFQPVVGNGRHFELGGGINAHGDLWSNDDSTFQAYIDGYLVHSFKKTQFRTFDTSGMPMSRYALVKQLTFDSSANVNAGDDAFGYAGVLNALGDVNTALVDVSMDVRGEAVIDLIYSNCNWDAGLGYNFAGQTREKGLINSSNDTASAANGSVYYGFLGESRQNSIKAALGNTDDGKALSLYLKTCGDVTQLGQGGAYDYGTSTGADSNGETTLQDVFTLPDLNSSGYMEGQILHSLFAHVGYTWSDCDWMPQLEVFGSVGFSPDSYKTYQKWNLGANFGLSF